MDTQIQTFTRAARQCAMLMLSNAQYIENELPRVRLPEGMDGQLRAVCAALTATKHDVISELFELGEMGGAGATPEELTRRIHRSIQWLGETIEELNQAVRTLQAATKTDFRMGLGFMLVAESAVNILTAFTEAAQAAPRAEHSARGSADPDENELQ